MRYIYTVILILQSVYLLSQQSLIRGTVIDGDFNEPLFCANVLVVGTTNGVITDLDGNFELEVNPGLVSLQFSYIGYKSVTVSDIEVKPSKVTAVDVVTLNEDLDIGIEIVVTAEAIRKNEVALINMKLKSAGMIDGISSDNIKKIGDGNVAEATKRITGVTVDGGKYVYVRGLGDRYSKTTLNGVDIPGLDPDRNTLQMDIFPTNLINNIVINKNFTAELPADFTGGLLNIETKDFPEDKAFSISYGTSYNPQYHFNPNYLSYENSSTDFLGIDDGSRAIPINPNSSVPTPLNGASQEQIKSFNQSFNPNLSANQTLSILDFNAGLSLGNQLSLKDGNKLGYVFSLTYKSDYKFYDNVEFGEYQRDINPNEYELVTATSQTGEYGERSFLLGVIGGIAYKTKASKIKITLMRIQKGESRAGKFNIVNDAYAVGQSGYEAVSDNLEYNQQSLSNLLINGKHIISDWNIDWRVSPTYSTSDDPDIRKTAFSYDGNYSFSAGEAGNPSRIWRTLSELNATAKIDIKRDFKFDKFDFKLKFGGSQTYKLRDYGIYLYELMFWGQNQQWESPNADLVLQDQNMYPSSQNNVYYQSSNANPNPNEYSSNVWNTGLYLSGEFNLFKKLKTTIGVRGEYYVQRHTGRDISYSAGNTIQGKNLVNAKVLESFNLFPTINTVYSLTPKQNLRLSYARTIARPSFKELSFAQILDPITNRIFNGSLFSYSSIENGELIYSWDGNLVETNIDNLDLRWELFLKDKGQFISASLFFKNFINPIELVRIPEQQTSTEYQTRNVGDGRLFGLEFEIRKNFDFISDILSNLNFSCNVTWVHSSISMSELEYNSRKAYERTSETILNTRDMAGQSPYVINTGISYNNSDIGLDIGIFYNVKGPTLLIVGTGMIPDIYSEPFHSLNFSMIQRVGKDKNTTIKFKVSNMLNDNTESFYNSYQASKQIFSRINYGVSFSLGISHKF
tara:strand:- start:1274 stop:4174 length:2901 start_codon:yes stop_codon:yes gene_type:complete